MSNVSQALIEKRNEVLNHIKPIFKAFNITDYDYIVKEKGQRETLRIYDTYIGCTSNSLIAVEEEIIGWLFVKRFCKERSIGAFKTQTINEVKRYWIGE